MVIILILHTLFSKATTYIERIVVAADGVSAAITLTNIWLTVDVFPLVHELKSLHSNNVKILT